MPYTQLLTRCIHLLVPGALLLAASPLRADWIDDPAQLHDLLAGNSLYGTYNNIQFRQIMHADGSLTVAVKDEAALYKANWYISEQSEYCENWPDHTSCFRIGRTDSNQLMVQGKQDEKIDSYWHRGEIDLRFEQTPLP